MSHLVSAAQPSARAAASQSEQESGGREGGEFVRKGRADQARGETGVAQRTEERTNQSDARLGARRGRGSRARGGRDGARGRGERVRLY